MNDISICYHGLFKSKTPQCRWHYWYQKSVQWYSILRVSFFVCTEVNSPIEIVTLNNLAWLLFWSINFGYTILGYFLPKTVCISPLQKIQKNPTNWALFGKNKANFVQLILTQPKSCYCTYASIHSSVQNKTCQPWFLSQKQICT